MNQKKSPEPTFVPAVRPPEIEAMRNKLRASLPEYVDEDIINDNVEPFDHMAPVGFMPQIIRIDDDGFRKIVAPDGSEYDYLEDDDDDEEEEEGAPENNEPAGYEYDTSGAFTIRSGAEWYAQNDDDLLPEAQLFGDLWMQNDLCIMFADTNAGKSILAVQIADSISRGLPIPGFGCTAEPAPVLYFDFELSDYQFRSRYSSAENGKYPFTAGFHRATLNDYSPKQRRFSTFEEFISNEIENALLCCKAKTLIIDNISCLRYGTHNTTGALNLMQYLQGIKRTYQISILVLAHTPKRNPSKPLSRNDLQGSKMLINLADSAFALGESLQQPGLKYLKQVKQRGAPETHGAENVCLGCITRTGSFMHFTFAGNGHESDHLAPQTEQYRRATEYRIAELDRQGYSVRKIAAQLSLAPTTIFRALKKLKKCGEEEEGCADEEQCVDVRVCECADEEIQVAGTAGENQYLAIQQKAPALCGSLPTEGCREGFSKPVTLYEAKTHDDPIVPASCDSLPTGGCREGFSEPVIPNEPQTHDDPKAPALCDSLPTGGCREGFSKPVTLYEAKTHDDPKTPASCDSLPTGGCREGFSKPVIPYEAESYDDSKPPAPCDSLPTEGCREEFSKPVIPYEAESYDDPKAPALCDSLPTGGCREGFSKPIILYETKTHDDQYAATQICHTEAQACPEVTRREVRPKPVILYEAQTHDDPKAPALCDSLPTGGCREGFSEPVIPYEAESYDDPKAPASCDSLPTGGCREGFSKPVTLYEAKTYDGQNANVP